MEVVELELTVEVCELVEDFVVLSVEVEAADVVVVVVVVDVVVVVVVVVLEDDAVPAGQENVAVENMAEPYAPQVALTT